tara:strand:- start:122 stop:325 length:204 start_codon:yes stop_codon:yes gene_type:complete
VAVRVAVEAQAFQPFQPFQPFFTTKPHGVGLGLSLCRAFIKENGGRLWSQPGADGGTAFFFTLPLAP